MLHLTEEQVGESWEPSTGNTITEIEEAGLENQFHFSVIL
jgi:hypothetical protein